MGSTKEWNEQYRKSERGKAVLKKASLKYYNSQKGKDKYLAYSKSNKRKENLKRYTQTEKGKEVYRKGQEKYRKTEHGRFMLARKAAKTKEKEWDILEQDYGALTAKSCYYCSGRLNPTGIGLDRLDNTKGYLLSNVVPCCSRCNKLRGDWLTPEETRIAINAVLQYRNFDYNKLPVYTIPN